MKISFSDVKDAEFNRLDRIDAIIEDLFGHLAFDEVEVLLRNYLRVETRMIEVLDVKTHHLDVVDLCEDIEFRNVVFPNRLVPLVRRHDTFLVTVVLKGSRWEILYMSKTYRVEQVGEKSSESEKSNIC